MSEPVYQRWDVSQRRQHQFLMVCCFVLIFTGLPLRFAHQRGVAEAVGVIGGATVAGVLHRIAAAGLIWSAIWHVLYLLRRRRRRNLSTSMVPRVKDLLDARDTLVWLVRDEAPHPLYDRYNFIEKFEYWAMMWGTVIMIITGLVLWFPVAAARWVDGLGLQLAKVIHGYEAVLAAVSILLWHMYHAHLRADVFPMNWMWLTGSLTATEMRHHHPLELERLEQAAAAADEAPPTPAPEDTEHGSPSPQAEADSPTGGGAAPAPGGVQPPPEPGLDAGPGGAGGQAGEPAGSTDSEGGHA
ncbi:MAG: cytochrome b/b6 domain-containing protein [Armatimonadetes bacterium]|nr:cytochrome b/b6 domain-containing protein [Armatimonadota bacterium]